MEMINPFCGIERLDPGVVRMTICNAGKANILGSPTMEGLLQGFRHVSGDGGIRVLILAATGDRAFIGGADLKEMSQLEPVSAEAFISRLGALCEAVRDFPAPVVARIQGWCLGGGLEIAMACDMRVVTTEAKFAMPEVLVGIPSVIHAALLPRLIGWGRARWLIMTGATIDAATALSWGLVDVVAEPAKLDAALRDAIAPILKSGAQVVAAQKRLLRQWEDLPLRESVNVSIPIFASAFETGEPQHYMSEFLQRRGSS